MGISTNITFSRPFALLSTPKWYFRSLKTKLLIKLLQGCIIFNTHPCETGFPMLWLYDARNLQTMAEYRRVFRLVLLGLTGPHVHFLRKTCMLDMLILVRLMSEHVEFNVPGPLLTCDWSKQWGWLFLFECDSWCPLSPKTAFTFWRPACTNFDNPKLFPSVW